MLNEYHRRASTFLLSARSRPQWLAFAALLLFVVSISAPFLNQAFHMDDAIYLVVARNVFRQPLFPQDLPVHVEGIWASDLGSMEHPPLTAYLLAGVAAVMGRFAEVPSHVAFLTFPALLALAMISLSRRFVRRPILASLLLLTMPVVQVLSHTLMTDLAQLSLWVLSAALFVHGIDTGSGLRIWTAAAAAAIACLVSPAALCLIPLLCLYAFLAGKPRAAWPILAAPPSVLGIWWLAGYLHYGRLAPAFILDLYLSTEHALSPASVGRKTLYSILAVGGVTLSPIIVAAGGKLRLTMLSLAFGAGTAFLPPFASYQPSLKLMAALMAALGFQALLPPLAEFARSLTQAGVRDRYGRETLFLGAWLFGAIAFACLGYITGSARYLLPAAPPLVLLALRRLEVEYSNLALGRLGCAAVVMSVLTSLALGAADREFAEVYRNFAARLKESRAGQAGRLWITGEWGFRAYLERLGGEELGRRDPRPNPGDLLVVPTLATPYSTLFSDVVRHDSVVLIAPCRIEFDLAPAPRGTSLALLVGMPFADRSDGLDFEILWDGTTRKEILYSARLAAPLGRRWRALEVPLPESPGERSRISLSAKVGPSGDADADWMALSQARVRVVEKGSERVLLHLREQLHRARIEAPAGLAYHTPGNKPVLEMEIWLEQDPATRLVDLRCYRPCWPLRLLDDRSHAGFWSMGWGMLPFSLSAGAQPLEEIRTYEVTRKVDGFDERDPTWYAPERLTGAPAVQAQ